MKRTCLFLLAAAAVGAAGCGAPALGPAAPNHDAPVAPSEPRATVALRVDLEQRGDCEEAFDLALYANRGVDLVAWDQRRDSCTDRRIEVRYLPRRMTEADVVAAVRALAKRAEPSR